MAERIGLEATLDLSNWNRGIQTYLGSIAKMEKQTAGFASTAGRQFVGLGQGALKFGAIAGGIAVGGAAALTAGIVAMGFAALNEVSKFERMTLSITNLVAREISGGQLVEQSRQTITQLTEKEATEIETLTQKIQEEGLERQTMTARIQEQRQRVIDLTAAYGDNGLNVQTAKARLAEMEFELTKSDAATAKMSGRIDELNAKNGQLVTTLEKVRVGQMSMGDAMKEASPRAQELIKWIQILAIQSPFTSEGIQMAFQTALAYGFTTEQAQRLTEAEVDFTAATGRSAQSADLIALALGQIQSRGKLSAQELRQLSEQGIGTNRILEDMGFSLDDVTNGLVDTDDFIEAVIQDMEIFKGAAKAQATTFSGLVSSLSEVKSIGLREFFTGTFEAIRPYLSNFVDFLTKAAFETGSIRALGDALGQSVGGALATINRWATLISQLGGGAGLAIFTELFGPQGIALWKQVNVLIGNISITFSEWGGILEGVLPSFSELSGDIIPSITKGLTFLNQHFEEFKGALLGIGAVLGGAVFAALVAGILALLTPINLIIAAAALLGAAWAGNWGGIREITASVVGFLVGLFDSFVTAVTPGFAKLELAFTKIGVVFQGTGITWQQVGEALLQSTVFVITSIVAVVAGLVTGIATAISLIVANWQGMMTFLGGATAAFQQVLVSLADFWSSVWAGDMTGAVEAWKVGISSLAAFVGNIFSAIFVAIITPLEAVSTFTTEFIQGMVTFWQEMSNTLVGNSIIPDMINSIISYFTMLPDKIIGALSGLTEAIGGIFGGLFGGGEEGPTFDTAAATAAITAVAEATGLAQAQFGVYMTSVSNFTLITLPGLQQMFIAVATIMLAQLNLVQLTGVLPLDQAFILMTTVTLPGLQAMAVSVAGAIISAYIPVQSLINAITSAVNTLAGAFGAMGQAAVTAGGRVQSGMDNATDAIEDLIKIVKEATKEFGKMADAAREAAAASKSAGSASGQAGGLGFRQGLGFQAGTSGNTGGLLGLGFKIPSGYPNDSFGPLFAQSGEEMLVTPRGTSIEDLVFSRLANLLQGSLVQGGSVTNVNYNFAMTVNTGADVQGVIRQYGVMQGLLGA